LNDLFGAEPELAPAEPAAEPAAEPEAPAAEPTAEGDDLDDLFGDTPAEEVPAEEAGSIEDLFGELPTETEEPAAAEPVVESNSIDDLFGDAMIEVDPIETFAELPAPIAQEAEQAAVKVVAAETDQFNPMSNTHVRTWIDNSGSFSTEGRLVEINSTNVRLLKSSGRTCTVPNIRLSEADAAYVDSIRRQLVDSPLVAMVPGK
jgi:hypothetical protein